MKKLFLLLALCGMVAVGCTEGGVDDNIDNGGNNTEQPGEDDDDENEEKPDDGSEIPDDAYISINKDILTFSPDGESVEVKVYSNYEWTLTNNCDWVTASISGGEASEEGTTITLTADLTYDDREGTITFSCGKAKKLLVVSQSFKEAIIADENNVFNVPAEGGNVIINYQTTVECEVIIPEEAKSWISLAPETRGLESGCTTLNIAKSNVGANRRAVVKVVKMGDQSVFAEYTITQERNMDYIILYTTTNGETISPKDFDYLTNTYEDGVGMLAFDGSKVTSIGYQAFYFCTSLTSVTIPDSVKSIDNQAFYYCDSLTSVTIGNGVTSIGEWAFMRCTSLTSVTIGNGVTSIGGAAFNGCTSLTSITIPNGVTSIGGSAFGGCTSLTSVTIGNGVTSIGDYAFSGCNSLTSITIGKGVTSIGYDAFSGCTGELIVNCNIPSASSSEYGAFCGSKFTLVTIGDSVTSIGNDAFNGCNSLTSVTIGNGVTSIGENTFSGCDSLTSVYITDISAWCKISFDGTTSNPLWYSGNLYLNNELVTDLIIPDSVTSIGDCTFSNCTSLTSITIPDSVTSIGYGAFIWCTSLTSVTIPDSVTSIGNSAFYNCTSLTSVTIPDSVKSVGSQAFYDCDSLTSITIPDSVTSIGDYAFKGCTSLKEVYCKPTTPPTARNNMFSNDAPDRKIYVPRNSVSAYKSAWSSYASDIVGYDF